MIDAAFFEWLRYTERCSREDYDARDPKFYNWRLCNWRFRLPLVLTSSLHFLDLTGGLSKRDGSDDASSDYLPLMEGIASTANEFNNLTKLSLKSIRADLPELRVLLDSLKDKGSLKELDLRGMKSACKSSSPMDGEILRAEKAWMGGFINRSRGVYDPSFVDSLDEGLERFYYGWAKELKPISNPIPDPNPNS